jgi:hypothetical protein
MTPEKQKAAHSGGSHLGLQFDPNLDGQSALLRAKRAMESVEHVRKRICN